ncbi:MAG: DMT family transporter [Burkholderiaceae bacterium]|nr:DMT family transporter [Burkholderiaceae bacterium]
MIGAVMLFSLMDSALKLLSAHYPPLQVAALRGMSSLPLICAYVVWRKATPSLFKVRWSLQLARASVGIATLAMFSYGLQTLSLANTYAIFFVAPLMITALSVPMLGERVDASRWWAIGIGFCGVLVVLRPSGAGMFSPAGLGILAGATGYALSAIWVRMLGRTDSSESMVFWWIFPLAVGAGLLAWPHWVAIRAEDWLVIAGLGLAGFFGQLLVTLAFKHGEASSIAPFEYTALAWGVALDWSLWHTLPDRTTLIGAAVIIVSGIYLVHRQTSVLEAEHP